MGDEPFIVFLLIARQPTCERSLLLDLLVPVGHVAHLKVRVGEGQVSRRPVPEVEVIHAHPGPTALHRIRHIDASGLALVLGRDVEPVVGILPLVDPTNGILLPIPASALIGLCIGEIAGIPELAVAVHVYLKLHALILAVGVLLGRDLRRVEGHEHTPRRFRDRLDHEDIGTKLKTDKFRNVTRRGIHGRGVTNVRTRTQPDSTGASPLGTRPAKQAPGCIRIVRGFCLGPAGNRATWMFVQRPNLKALEAFRIAVFKTFLEPAVADDAVIPVHAQAIHGYRRVGIIVDGHDLSTPTLQAGGIENGNLKGDSAQVAIVIKDTLYRNINTIGVLTVGVLCLRADVHVDKNPVSALPGARLIKMRRSRSGESPINETGEGGQDKGIRLNNSSIPPGFLNQGAEELGPIRGKPHLFISRNQLLGGQVPLQNGPSAQRGIILKGAVWNRIGDNRTVGVV